MRLAQTNFFTTVQDQLQQVEAVMQSRSDGQHVELAAALQHLLSSGGKRVRPAVALLFGGLLRGDPEKLVTLAAAIEMLHTATLVHDDLIDGALLRRGNPTLNSRWSPAATVLTGDFIFAQAAKLAAQTESVAVMQVFANTLSVIVNGELAQLFSSRGLASREDYQKRIYAKTASLFETAAGSAAMLCGVSEEQQDQAFNYGHELGMAFQIVDDILDFTSEQQKMGKPVASDLRQGLITLPALNYLESHPQDPDMHLILNGNRYNEETFERLLDHIRGSGAIEKALDEARAYVQRALDALEALPDGSERQSLVELAEYVVERKL